ncbi:MAG TPA: hypothetical protein VIL74_07810 [Pyrinomonadaceae bacterium]|jgi:hypothetical protein
MNAKIFSALLLAALLFFNAQTIRAAFFDWLVVGKNRQTNISGMALVEQAAGRTSFIIVHDNKKKKQSRAAIVTLNGGKQPQFTALEWRGGEFPVDLEAVTKIPGAANGFMAITSAGRVYRLELETASRSLKVVKSFDVPSIPPDGNFEGFSLQRVGGGYLAVWAERGEDAKPATLFWGNFDLSANAFRNVGSIQIKVPYPETNVRHISDVKVDAAGKVFISSAADPGNDGPFTSAVYLAGAFDLTKLPAISFKPESTVSQLFAVENRKIEAFELLPEAVGGMVYGTDDENLGSAIYFSKAKK